MLAHLGLLGPMWPAEFGGNEGISTNSLRLLCMSAVEARFFRGLSCGRGLRWLNSKDSLFSGSLFQF